MPKQPSNKQSKSTDSSQEFAEVISEILKHIDRRFDEAAENLKAVEQRLTMQLDRIEFQMTGQERRIATLEDRLRIVATKLGLEFRTAL
jgi:DNA anti-recombination protein RmuC